MKLVEVFGKLINTEYITSIEYNLDESRIEITMLNGKRHSFPVDKEEYEEIVRKLNPTEDISIIDCAKRVRDFCKSHRDNTKTNSCECCPFYYKGDYFMGCLLTDSWGPGDWQLD